MNITRTFRMTPVFGYESLASYFAIAGLDGGSYTWQSGVVKNTGAGDLLIAFRGSKLSAPTNDLSANTLESGDSFSFDLADLEEVFVRNVNYSLSDRDQFVYDSTERLALVDIPEEYLVQQTIDSTLWKFTGADPSEPADWTEIDELINGAMEVSGTPV